MIVLKANRSGYDSKTLTPATPIIAIKTISHAEASAALGIPMESKQFVKLFGDADNVYQISFQPLGEDVREHYKKARLC